jgi:hypothetical protein
VQNYLRFAYASVPFAFSFRFVSVFLTLKARKNGVEVLMAFPSLVSHLKEVFC